jgi:hypothetical protein
VFWKTSAYRSVSRKAKASLRQATQTLAALLVFCSSSTIAAAYSERVRRKQHELLKKFEMDDPLCLMESLNSRAIKAGLLFGYL